MIKMLAENFKINNHADRLKKFYSRRGVSPLAIQQIIAAKLNRLDPALGQEDYSVWLSKLLNFINQDFGPIHRCLDLGCGTGEFVVLMNKLGLKSDGCDIYIEELKIATELVAEYKLKNVNIFNSDTADYTKYDLITLFSVVEHLDDEILRQILQDLNSANVKNIFILVPNKFKIIDDHTGVPFLGILSRSIARGLLKVLGKKYELSENFDWDVWYRSPKKIESICKKCGYSMQKIPDSLVYPPLETACKISQIKPKSSIKTWIMRCYTSIIKTLWPSHPLNDYQYLNFILTLDDKHTP